MMLCTKLEFGMLQRSWRTPPASDRRDQCMTYTGACCPVSQRSSPLHQHRWGGMASVDGLGLPLRWQDAWNLCVLSDRSCSCHKWSQCGRSSSSECSARFALLGQLPSPPPAAPVTFQLFWQHHYSARARGGTQLILVWLISSHVPLQLHSSLWRLRHLLRALFWCVQGGAFAFSG